MPYIPFTEDQKMTANTIDLPEYLRMRGEKLERAGREFKLIYTDGSGRHDSITMSDSTWFDHKNQVGGGPIKFMQYHYGMTFADAVQALLGYTILPQQHSSPHEKTKAEKKKDFVLPEANPDMHRVYAYLIKQRYIAPEIITHFARQKTLYEDTKHHNAVFVGLDENGVARQAHKRSTTTFGNSFRMTCEGSDTRYSFSHFGTSNTLFVFEAPIDMLSYLTLYPDNWQEHSYIALNGVYENAMLRALETHDNLTEIILCVDNDEGGIEAVDRLSDLLKEKGYTDIQRYAPEYKDWNECLKARNGAEALPAALHRRKQIYLDLTSDLQKLNCSATGLMTKLNAAHRNRQYKYLAEYALAGSAFFLHQAGCKAGFEQLCAKLKKEYKPYTDKGRTAQKRRNLSDKMREVSQDMRQCARTAEQAVDTAKKLYQLADCALRLCTDELLTKEQSPHNDENFGEEPDTAMCFAN